MDKRIVYGLRCTWWEHISQVVLRARLPACPYCGGLLREMPSEQDWWNAVHRHVERTDDREYPDVIEWLRGRQCYRTLEEARDAFEARKRDVER